jgi:hypothetical protein
LMVIAIVLLERFSFRGNFGTQGDRIAAQYLKLYALKRQYAIPILCPTAIGSHPIIL